MFGLLFTISMGRRYVFENANKSRRYTILAIMSIILMGLEMTSILMLGRVDTDLVIYNRIINFLGFLLSPVFIFLLLMFSLHSNEKYTFHKKLLTIPLLFNTLLSILSLKTGWVFLVDANNHYSRGPLFSAPFFICAFYYLLFIIISVKNRDNYDRGDLGALLIIITVPVLSIVLQIAFLDSIVIWNSAAISLILYYVFLRELQFTHDIQTDVKNRAAFEKEMLQCIKHKKSASIISFDVNNLKQTNDIFGHKAGDELLFEAAQEIKKSFDNIGFTFRVGGDEFCVICEEIPIMIAEHALSNLDKLLITVNKTRYNKLEIAYGYAYYDTNGEESIYAVYSTADKLMYIHKAKIKGAKSTITEE